MRSKVIPIKRQDEKLPLAICREILNRNDRNYTDEQVILIRELLYRLAAIALEEYEAQQKVIKIKEHKNPQHAQSNYLRAG